jgi:hypothetical protein
VSFAQTYILGRLRIQSLFLLAECNAAIKAASFFAKAWRQPASVVREHERAVRANFPKIFFSVS